MFRLRSLRVEKFRDLRGGAEFTFGHGVHLVLGRNASGKTNLLKLIAMIGRGDFSPLAGEEVAFEWEMEGEVGETPVPAVMRGRLEQGAPPAELLADPRFAMAGALPRPSSLLLEVSSGGRVLRVVKPSGEGWRYTIDGGREQSLETLAEVLGADALVLLAFSVFRQTEFDELALLLLSFAVCQGRHDEGLLSFHALLGQGAPGGEVSPVVPLVSLFRHPHASAWEVRGPLLVPLGAPLPHQQEPDATLRARPGDPTLGSLAAALGADLVELTPREEAKYDAASGTLRIDYRGLDLRITFGDRSISDPSLLSYGQRRLIAFFWYAASSPKGILVADELGNGLHHSWLRACFEEIGERQAFIAAQDPLVFDHVEFADAADMRARVIVCTPTPPNQPGGRGWSWRQPDEGEAAEFMAAYDVGIQRVSELLRAHGLW